MPSIITILERHQPDLEQVIQRYYATPPNHRHKIGADLIRVALEALCRRGWRGTNSESVWTHPVYSGIYHWSQAFRLEFPP